MSGKRKQYKCQRGWSLDRQPLSGSNCLTAWTLYFSGGLRSSISLNACNTAVVTSPNFSGYLWLISRLEGVRTLVEVQQVQPVPWGVNAYTSEGVC